MKRRRWFLPLVALIVMGAMVPSYIRVYQVAGSSDAPSFLVGDRILVNKSAYDIRLPYMDTVILSHSQPQRGDVVMFRTPGDGSTVFKRVIGCPGDMIAMRDNRLEINSIPLQYEPIDVREHQSIEGHNSLGTIIEREMGNGRSHLITHTPGMSRYASFGPVHLPKGHYFMMGDNRDNSLDSRMYGPVSHLSILGKVSYGQRSAP